MDDVLLIIGDPKNHKNRTNDEFNQIENNAKNNNMLLIINEDKVDAAEQFVYLRLIVRIKK